MASKRKPSKKPSPGQSTAAVTSDENEAALIARTMLHPTVQAAFTLKQYGKAHGDLDLFGLIEWLTELTCASNKGDLKHGEALLTAQACALDAIFHNLARRAINAEHMDNLDRYLKLALRAQSQSRAAWEALSAIKNPPAMGYVRQANIAHGPQQVNNAPAKAGESPRTRENHNLQNKLLEATDGDRLDTGAKSTAGGNDPELATVGAIDGTKVKRG